MATDVDDGYLVRRAQEGYLDAYEELVRRYSPLAYRVAYRLLGDHHDAQDVAQEALTAAWQQLPRFRAEASYPTWLYRIVTRRALNRLTRGRTRDASDLLEQVPDDDPGPAQHAERSHATDAVTAAVAALPLAQRVAVVLHHFEGLPYDQVAQVTRSTVPAVRSHLYRARRTLASTLEQWR
jgi:RNA polymerase sigma-70 factor (ECF subfamily)